jgi:hypothetical protein
MNCHELASRIERLEPDAAPRDVARLCLLMANHVDSFDSLGDESQLSQAWHEASLRLQVAADQHAAMTLELEGLAQADPGKFSMQQVWVLIRAIKVQSQVLQLYVGSPPAEKG